MSSSEQNHGSESLSRRKFIQMGTASAVALSAINLARANAQDAAGTEAPAHSTMVDVPFEKRNPRLAFIGVGRRGTLLLNNLLAAGAQVAALCDLIQEHADHGASLVIAAGQPKPQLYTDGPYAFETMLGKDGFDLVVIATPWSWHCEMAVAAMKHGKDAWVEVPAVVTLDECWKIVKTSEETRKQCVMLENCCYGYNETLILRMVHDGKFGDLIYGEGAYLHDMRAELFSDLGVALWRRAEHTKRDGNLYPTHGLGPVANYMGIQRGDRFGCLVSMSSPQRGLDLYRQDHLKPGDPRLEERYVCGDMNTSLIKTVKGLTITVKHGVCSPRPYDRINMIAGTKGVFEDYPPRIYFDGMNKDESWGSIDNFKQYAHPLWQREGALAAKVGGHGGMDYLMLSRLLQCVREGLPPDMDVYDAAAWSAVGALSVISVSQGSAPIEFPDFTQGKWMLRSASAIATQA
jgi:hypothetical protein